MTIKGVITEDTKTLIPNKEHKNFTETNTIIPKGTIVEGEMKSIQGKRKGEDFLYRVFFTNDGHIIFQNKITKFSAIKTYFFNSL